MAELKFGQTEEERAGLPALANVEVDFTASTDAAIAHMKSIGQEQIDAATAKAAEDERDRIAIEGLAAEIRQGQEESKLRGEALRGNVQEQIEREKRINETGFLERVGKVVFLRDKDLNRADQAKDEAAARKELSLFERADQARRQNDATTVNLLQQIERAETAGEVSKAAALKAELDLVLNSLSAQQSLLSGRVSTIQAQIAIDKQQRLERQDKLASLDPIRLESLEAQANAEGKGGKIVLDGIEFGAGEIRDARITKRKSEADLATANLAAEKGNLELADLQFNRYLDGLTLEQEQQINADNGQVFDETGRVVSQIPAQLRADHLIKRIEAEEQIDSTLRGRQAAAATVQISIDNLQESMTELTTRGANLVGGVNNLPRDYKQRMGLIAAEVGSMLPPEGFDAGLLPVDESAAIAKEVQRQNEVLKAEGVKFAETFAGGKGQEATQISVTGYLNGTSVAPETAAETLMRGSVGGLPPGVEVGTPDEAGMLAMRSVYVNEMLPSDVSIDLNTEAGLQALQSALFNQVGGAPKIDNPALEAKALDAYYNAYAGARITQIINGASKTAKLIPVKDSEGALKLHPFSNVDDGLYMAALTESTRRAAANINREQFPPGSQGEIAFRTELAAEESVILLRSLDMVDPGTLFSPEFDTVGEAYLSFIATPEFQKSIAAGNSESRESFPGYLAENAMGLSKRLARDMNNQLMLYQSAQATQKAQVLGTQLDRVESYGASNVRSDSIIMAAGTQQGFDEGAINRFIDAVEEAPGAQITMPGMDGPGRFSPTQVDQFILTGNFEDPELEKMRKSIAQIWEVTSKSMDGVMARMESKRLQDRKSGRTKPQGFR